MKIDESDRRVPEYLLLLRLYALRNIYRVRAMDFYSDLPDQGGAARAGTHRRDGRRIGDFFFSVDMTGGSVICDDIWPDRLAQVSPTIILRWPGTQEEPLVGLQSSSPETFAARLETTHPVKRKR
jgi:hypothetical protein